MDLTQRELAERAGCSAATIRKLEADERRPSKRTAAQLARALGVDAAEIDAFVTFARAGWADAPPELAKPMEAPWREPPGPKRLAVVAAPRRARGAAPRAVVRPSGPSSHDHGFVAREEELARLHAALEEARSGALRTVFIAGEAGQGKSALLEAFAARAVQRHPDLVVVTGSCNAYVGVGDPFLPFREVVAQLLGDAPMAGRGGALAATRASRLRQLAPYVRDAVRSLGPHLIDTLVPRRLVDPGATVAAYPEGSAPRSFAIPEEALRSEGAAVLDAVAHEVPLLVVLDDLHWVDRSSAELLFHLGRTPSDASLLILGAYRPSEVAGAVQRERHPLEVVLGELERRQGRVVIDLARADARAFLDAYLDAEPNALDDAFRDGLWRQSGGQPLLTVELWRDLVERGDLARDADGRWATVRPIAWDRVPGRVAGALSQRLSRVEPQALELLRVASVEGERFTAQVVAQVAGRDLGEVVRTFGTLSRRHRLVSEGELRRMGDRRVEVHRFRHDLIQRFVYGEIEPGVRRHLHGAVAEALVTVVGDELEPGVLAHHLRAGPAPERAAPHLRRAGDRARRSGGLEEATAHYRAALRLAREPDDAWRAAVLASLAECLWLRGHLEQARQTSREAQRLYLAVGDTAGAGRAELTAARTLFEQGSSEASLRALHRARATLEQGPESAELARAISAIAQQYMVSSRADEAVSWGERALAIAERVGAEDVEVHAWNNVGAALAQGSPERRNEGLALVERSLRAAKRLGLVYDACRAAYNLAEVRANFGELEAARGTYRELIDLAARHQIFAMESAGRLGLWRLDWRMGRWSAAFGQRPALEGLVARTEPGSLKNVTMVLDLALADLDLGAIDRAWRLLAPVAENLEAVEEPQTRVPYLLARLRHAAAAGDVAAADVRARALVAIAASGIALFDSIAASLREVVRWWTRPRGGGTDRIAGPDAERRDLALTLLATVGTHVGPAEGAASRFEGRAGRAWVAGDPRSAADALLQAADAWHAGEMPLHEARACRDAARAYAAVEDVDRGARARTRADALLATLARAIPDGDAAAVFLRDGARW